MARAHCGLTTATRRAGGPDTAPGSAQLPVAPATSRTAPRPSIGMGRRATQPAKENAADPGTAKRRTYGPKTVRGDTGSLALSGHERVRVGPPPVSRVARR